MKRILQYFAFSAAFLAAGTTYAQETDNINNRYGPPNFTGGTVETPSETFALYHQQTAALHRTYRINTVPIDVVYPNPASTYARIVLAGNTTEPVTVSVINMNGVLVRSYEYSAGAGRFDIDISSLPDGLYALQVQERGKEAQSIQLSKRQ
jgi:hypothetical protein